MRLLIRNCLKYTQQYQNGTFEKANSDSNGILISNKDLPLISCTRRSMGNSLTFKLIYKLAGALSFIGFKNRYVQNHR